MKKDGRRRTPAQDKQGGKEDDNKTGGRRPSMTTLPSALLHNIFIRLLKEDLADAVRLGACSKALMAVFRSSPALKLSRKSCQKCRDDHLNKAVLSLLKNTTSLQTLKVNGKAFKTALFCLHYVQQSLRNLVVKMDGYDDDADAEDNFTEKYLFLQIMLPKLTSLRLANVKLDALQTHALHKLTSLTLIDYKVRRADCLQSMLEDLPLLKNLEVSNEELWEVLDEEPQEELIIRHSSLENIIVFFFEERDVAFLGTPSLKKLCLAFEGQLYLDMPRGLQSVHICGGRYFCITGGGRKARAKYLEKNRRNGPVAKKSLLMCEEGRVNDKGSSSVSYQLPRPPLQSLYFNPEGGHQSYGNIGAFIAEISSLEVLDMGVYNETEHVRMGPFPRLKELRVIMKSSLLDFLAFEGNFPVMAKLLIWCGVDDMEQCDIKAVETLLCAPQLRDAKFVIKSDSTLPAWFVHWVARMVKRYPHASVHFGEAMPEDCCLCI